VKYDLLAVPVVSEDGELLGIITVDDVLTALVSDRMSRKYINKFSYLAIMRALKGGR
jgi:Mg/Co/Ni transporter MgtE